MIVDRPQFVHSDLSRVVTLDGVTVSVRIYRQEDQQKWALLVVAEGGTATLWDDPFDTEIEALAAFQIAVQEEGMASFLEDGFPQTIH